MNRRNLLLSTLALSTISCAQWRNKNMLYQTISSQDAYEMMKKGGVTVVDVREPDEYARSRIPGAINWPLSMIEKGTVPERFADKTHTYLIYCRSGRRSAKSADILSKAGWTSLYDFGGIMDWPYETEN